MYRSGEGRSDDGQVRVNFQNCSKFDIGGRETCLIVNFNNNLKEYQRINDFKVVQHLSQCG